MYNLRNKKSKSQTTDDATHTEQEATFTSHLATQTTSNTQSENNTTSEISKDNDSDIFYLNECDIPMNERFFGFDVSPISSPVQTSETAILQMQTANETTNVEAIGHVTFNSQSDNVQMTASHTNQSEHFPMMLCDNISSQAHQSAAADGRQTNEWNSNVSSKQTATSASDTPTSVSTDLLTQIALLMRANMNELKDDIKTDMNNIKTENNARFEQLGTQFEHLKTDINNISTENNAQLNQLKTEIKAESNTQFEHLKTNLNQFSQHIENKVDEIHNNCVQLKSKLNTIENTQSQQSEKIKSLEIKFSQDLQSTIRSIREDLILDIETQYNNIKDTMNINNNEIIQTVNTKLHDQTLTYQLNLSQQKHDLVSKI